MLGHREEVTEMPWEQRPMDEQRLEFIVLAMQPHANITQLCQRFGISRKTAYKWKDRYAGMGPAGLVDQSRRPHGSPCQTSPAMEAQVVVLRDEHPAWGGRKLHHRLIAMGMA